jgi:hypothetical protein
LTKPGTGVEKLVEKKKTKKKGKTEENPKGNSCPPLMGLPILPRSERSEE